MKVNEVLSSQTSKNLTELFDKPYPYTLNIGPTDAEANIILPDKSKLRVGFLKGKNKWDMAFSRNGSFDADDQGDQYKVLSTVVAVFIDFVNKVKPAKITFDADKDSTGSRADVYTKMLSRYASKMGYDFSVKNPMGDSILQFTLTKKKQTAEDTSVRLDKNRMKSTKVDEIFGFGKKAQMRRGAMNIAKDVVIEQILKPALMQFKGAFEGIDIKEDKGDYLVTGYGFKIHLDVAESHLSPMVNKESGRPTYYVEGDLARDLDSTIKAKYKAWTEANADNIHSKMITMPETMTTFEANNKTKDGYYEQNIVIRFRILDGDINKKFK